MTNRPKKKWFNLQENESIEDCLKRMELEGYSPVRRLEKPIFHEVEKDGVKQQHPIKRDIQFQGLEKDEY